MDLLSSGNSNKRVFKLDGRFTPKQLEAEKSGARFEFLRWGRKTGKTHYSERKALKKLGPPNSTYWHVAPTYKQAKLISWDKFKRLIPADALARKPNDTDLHIQLKNGSQLFLMGSDEPDSLRGPEPDGMTLEEAAYHKPDVWSKVLRPALMPKRGTALFISTPAGFNWFKDLEEEARRSIQQKEGMWFFSHATCYDNPYLDRMEIELAKRECKDEPEVWRQEYLAEYESSVGRVFANFNDSRHFKRFELPAGSFECYRSVDWGMRDDCGQLWGYIQNKKLFIYREQATKDLSAPQQAQIMKNLTTAREQVKCTAISHDAVKEDPAMKGLTVLWHFRQAGINPIRPSTKDKKNSRAMIKQLLAEDRLIVSHDCPKLRKQILASEWKDTTMERPEDGNDDLLDSLHYLVEMVQFELFLNSSYQKEQTMEEIYAEIAKEKLAQRISKVPVPGIFQKPDDGMDFDNTVGGYF